MQDKVVVITGATSGIGQVAAAELAALGARIVLVARDRTRSARTLAVLRHRNPRAEHRAFHADLSRLQEMKRIGQEIATSEPRIDVLMNNAGAIFDRRQVTEDGLERTFALNHMSYFVVTNCIRERLLATPGARVVNTASAAHRYGTMDFADLQSAAGYGAFKAYGRSKLCNILFTRELARRLNGTGVTANCLHPGFVATRFGDGGGGVGVLILRFLKLFALSPENGAKTMIHLASSDTVSGISGEYFDKCLPAKPEPAAQDDEAARRLWAESAKLAGIGN
jgi:NAD(P)-dependent dehydrogenase (short-subunit alcohol dehydrogenase family)